MWLLASAVASAGSPVFSRYTSHDGLAHDRVLRIVRDSRGFLWFCTAEGLSRFDGQRFRSFGLAEGLPVAFVADFLESRDGSYWVATDGGGVARLQPEAPSGEKPFTVVSVGADTVSSKVCRLAEDAQGALWAGTMGGLFRLVGRGDRFLPVPLGLPGIPDRSVRVWALAATGDGSVWVGHDHGLSRVAGNGAEPEHFAIRPTPAGDNVWDLRLDRGGRLWIAHERTIIALLPGPGAGPGSGPRPPWTRLFEGPGAVKADGSLRVPIEAGDAVLYSPAQGLVSFAAGAFLQASDGTLWIGNNGLSAFDGARIRSYTTADGLPDSAVISLAEDREGAIWMGTRTRGAVKLSRYDIESRSLSDVLGDEGVTSFLEDATGAVYAVTPARRMRRVDTNRGVTTLELPVPRGRRAPATPLARPGVLRSRDGGWWIASAAGLVRVAPTAPDRLALASPSAVYTTLDGLASDAIGLLHEDRGGSVWIGYTRAAERPLSRLSPATGAVQAYGAGDGLVAQATVSAMAEDAFGRLFVGFTEGGVARWEGQRFIPLHGLDPAEIGGVFDLRFDSEGRLWIATSRAGLERVTDPAGPLPRLDAFGVAQGLAGDSVRALVDDRWGRLYAATTRGIDCLDPSALSRLRRFTTAHGVRDYFFQSAFRDSRGDLWFGSRESVTRLAPERWPAAPAPVTLVERLQVSGVPVPLANVGQRKVGPLRLAHHQNSFQIDFLAIDLRGEPTRFQHRLDGVEGAWSAPSTERTVTYGHLAPGVYRFRVKAADAPDAAEAQVRFSIEPPLWARAWFRAAAVAALIALVGAGFRVRVARLLAMERVRTRIAADLHDDLGSALSRIALVSELVRREVEGTHADAARRLGDMAASARALLESTSDIVWSTDPRHDRMDDLVARVRAFGSDLFEPLGIAWQLDVDGDPAGLRLGAWQRRQVYLILKEALHNAARHSAARSVALRLSATRRSLDAELRDDGRGIDGRDARGGHGLVNMRSRAEAIGGRLEIASAAGAGTTLRLHVPLDHPAGGA